MRRYFTNTVFSALLTMTPLFSADLKKESTTGNEILLKQISKGFSQVAKKAIPAVVYIESSQSKEKKKELSLKLKKGPHENPFDYFTEEFFNRFFGLPYSEQQVPSKIETVKGTGFIISEDGFIVTNNHVVENTSKISVTLSTGKKVTATLIGVDPKTDLAVIKINEKELPYLSFGDSDKLDVGDWAIAVGNPFGLQASVTVGVVSAKGRNQLNIADFEDFIQTDAAINPGNSGGPLLDVEGEVIGVNTAIVTGSGGYMGIGFAIPSTMAKRIIDQLIKEGQVIRGYLGVTLQPIDNELANFYKLDSTKGALVTDVAKGSPGDQAGIKQEDIIVSFNGITVDNLSTFRNAVSLMAPGSKLSLKVNREGKTIQLNVVVGSAPVETLAQVGFSTQKLGLKVQNLTPELAQQFGYGNEKGVIITQVEPGSLASEALLKAGNLILAVNRKRVENIEEFQNEVREASKEGRVLLMVRQGEVVRFIALPVE